LGVSRKYLIISLLFFSVGFSQEIIYTETYENGDSIINSIREGDLLYTPCKKIDSARYTKAVRRPKGFIINNHKES